MRSMKRCLLVLFVAICLWPAVQTRAVQEVATEALAGFTNTSNGMVDQATFDADREKFEERDTIADGLGPVYNAQSCAECHQNPITGSSSQVTVMRAGHRDASGNFFEAPGGSLINDRAIHYSLQEHVTPEDEARSFRSSLSTLGDGYVEAIDDATLMAIAASQPRDSGGTIAGQVIRVPLLEAPGQMRVGRFGWKNQHASLLSFSADAYLNEIGITNRLLPRENSSMGRSVAAYDAVADPEDEENDIDAFARFMRATQVPPRDEALAATDDAREGADIFNQIGCAICHVPTITTAPAGTRINGGTFTIPPALGGKVIHPFSDFLLHDVGTGDGIVQNGGPATANKLRTPPLWGLHVRARLMHDAATLTLDEAIRRHAGEARDVVARYNGLRRARRTRLIAFLQSL
ncbi:MAG TPA: di-heme oxidoredictase family protein [Blastocatellia bacterium]|nr:di-heme oxidoredictase family protein [Blastocatellia bacterium]